MSETDADCLSLLAMYSAELTSVEILSERFIVCADVLTVESAVSSLGETAGGFTDGLGTSLRVEG